TELRFEPPAHRPGTEQLRSTSPGSQQAGPREREHDRADKAKSAPQARSPVYTWTTAQRLSAAWRASWSRSLDLCGCGAHRHVARRRAAGIVQNPYRATSRRWWVMRDRSYARTAAETPRSQ